MPGKAFLTSLLPYLSRNHVRMVHTAALQDGYRTASDVYDQVWHGFPLCHVLGHSNHYVLCGMCNDLGGPVSMCLVVQGRQYWHMHIQPRALAWDCPVSDSASAFIIYASTLRNLGWLPTQAAGICPCLALEVQLAERVAVGAPDNVLIGQALL